MAILWTGRRSWSGGCGWCLAVGLALAVAAESMAADDAETHQMKLGPVTLRAPQTWKHKEPTVRIIAFEFLAPAAKDDKQDGRFTVMEAGGTIEANLERWYAQFTQEDGGDTKKLAKVEKKTIADQTVHLVDVTGTYKDQRGPFAPAELRKNYRMLGAIIQTKEGNLFLKFYGPKQTIAEHEKAFRQMVEEMKAGK